LKLWTNFSVHLHINSTKKRDLQFQKKSWQPQALHAESIIIITALQKKLMFQCILSSQVASQVSIMLGMKLSSFSCFLCWLVCCWIENETTFIITMENLLKMHFFSIFVMFVVGWRSNKYGRHGLVEHKAHFLEQVV